MNQHHLLVRQIKSNVRQFAIFLPLFVLLTFNSCTVTYITGYDEMIDETTTEMLHDFNMFFIKLQRAIKSKDGGEDQKIAHFQGYYDELEVDLLVLETRAAYMGKKSSQAKGQVEILKQSLHQFKADHTEGFPDDDDDIKTDKRNGINSCFNSIIMLQKQLKDTGKAN